VTTSVTHAPVQGCLGLSYRNEESKIGKAEHQEHRENRMPRSENLSPDIAGQIEETASNYIKPTYLTALGLGPSDLVCPWNILEIVAIRSATQAISFLTKLTDAQSSFWKLAAGGIK
jgi:hypothetical protein